MILDVFCILLSIIVKFLSTILRNDSLSENMFERISERYLNIEPEPLDKQDVKL